MTGSRPVVHQSLQTPKSTCVRCRGGGRTGISRIERPWGRSSSTRSMVGALGRSADDNSGGTKAPSGGRASGISGRSTQQGSSSPSLDSEQQLSSASQPHEPIAPLIRQRRNGPPASGSTVPRARRSQSDARRRVTGLSVTPEVPRGKASAGRSAMGASWSFRRLNRRWIQLKKLLARVEGPRVDPFRNRLRDDPCPVFQS